MSHIWFLKMLTLQSHLVQIKLSHNWTLSENPFPKYAISHLFFCPAPICPIFLMSTGLTLLSYVYSFGSLLTLNPVLKSLKSFLSSSQSSLKSSSVVFFSRSILYKSLLFSFELLLFLFFFSFEYSSLK